MQDIYFRGRQPIPELLRIGLMTDHLAETLRLHPPEKPLVLEKGKVYRIAQQWQLVGNLTIEGSGAVILTDIPGMTGPDRAAISIWGRSNDDYIKGITIRNLTIRAADNCTSNYMLQAARRWGMQPFA